MNKNVDAGDAIKIDAKSSTRCARRPDNVFPEQNRAIRPGVRWFRVVTTSHANVVMGLKFKQVCWICREPGAVSESRIHGNVDESYKLVRLVETSTRMYLDPSQVDGRVAAIVVLGRLRFQVIGFR